MPINHRTKMMKILAFFKCILPGVRKLDSDQKFTFRMQTLQLLYNLQKSNSETKSCNFNSGTHDTFI